MDDTSVITPESFRLANLLCNILRDLTLGKDSGVRMLTVERNSIIPEAHGPTFRHIDYRRA